MNEMILLPQKFILYWCCLLQAQANILISSHWHLVKMYIQHTFTDRVFRGLLLCFLVQNIVLAWLNSFTLIVLEKSHLLYFTLLFSSLPFFISYHFTSAPYNLTLNYPVFCVVHCVHPIFSKERCSLWRDIMLLLYCPQSQAQCWSPDIYLLIHYDPRHY